ncbi:MAG TPA: hypothetical protein VFY18_01090 [Candidatus Limnocylindrales bacterium]|nr:hypothetical protein [Candidatus Limnocylindrales bacterium]
MSDQWPQFEAHEPNEEADSFGSSSANGADPVEAAEVSDASVDAIDAVAIAPDESPDESPASTEVTSEGSLSPEADSISVEAEDVQAPAGESPDPDQPSEFVAELLRAMQTTAGLERARAGEDADRRRQAHIDTVRAQEASEADRMRALADEDMKAIEAWADEERVRIQLERERRATELNQDLETSLAEHHAKVDRQIESIEAAVGTYRADIDAFFDGLDRETDPILIAQQAAGRPVFPTLDSVAEAGDATPEVGEADDAPAAVAEAEDAPAADAVTADAESPADDAPSIEEPPPVETPVRAGRAPIADGEEPAVIAVMAPTEAGERVESWAEYPDSASETADSAEPVGAAPRASVGGPGSMIHSLPVHRPMSWLRRDSNGDRSSTDD